MGHEGPVVVLGPNWEKTSKAGGEVKEACGNF